MNQITLFISDGYSSLVTHLGAPLAMLSMGVITLAFGALLCVLGYELIKLLPGIVVDAFKKVVSIVASPAVLKCLMIGLAGTAVAAVLQSRLGNAVVTIASETNAQINWALESCGLDSAQAAGARWGGVALILATAYLSMRSMTKSIQSALTRLQSSRFAGILGLLFAFGGTMMQVHASEHGIRLFDSVSHQVAFSWVLLGVGFYGLVQMFSPTILRDSWTKDRGKIWMFWGAPLCGMLAWNPIMNLATTESSQMLVGTTLGATIFLSAALTLRADWKEQGLVYRIFRSSEWNAPAQSTVAA